MMKPEKLNALPRNRSQHWGGWLLLLFALAVVSYYILGPSRGFFTADCTDTIVWAQASLDAGRVFNPDFSYAALLPFGAGLWYVPLIWLFGYNLAVQQAGLLIFLALLTAALLFIFHEAGLSFPRACSLTAAAILLLSASDKLREIFWGHVIYYSLSFLLLLIGAALLLRLEKLAGSPARRHMTFVVTAAAFFLLSAGAATNGIQGLAMFHFPLVLGLFWLHRPQPGQTASRSQAASPRAGSSPLARPFWFELILGLASAAAGLLLLLYMRRGGISAPYADAYSRLSAPSEWLSHIAVFPKRYFELLAVSLDPLVFPSVSDSLINLLRGLAALILLLLPLWLFARFRRQSQALQFLLVLHAGMVLIIGSAFIFGQVSNAAWRLIPAVATGLLCCLFKLGEISFSQAALQAAGGGFKAAAAAVLLAMMLASAGADAWTMLRLPYNYGQNNNLWQLTRALEADGVARGYASFWQANSVTLLSGETVQSRTVTINESGVAIRTYQSILKWYQTSDPAAACFLVLTPQEKAALQQSQEWQSLQPAMIRLYQAGDFTVMVFDQDLWQLIEPVYDSQG
ncbi:hypothetical protein HCH52_05765 [Oscillospiraceae bacterium HV4-5-C5C]|nr:hypothetical protein [Oscillospiraceae bacterium HV4-5-C5C]